MTEKNKKKLEAKKKRATILFMNLGLREHKSVKYYDRKRAKRELKNLE